MSSYKTLQLDVSQVMDNMGDGDETAYVPESRPSLWRVETESTQRPLIFKCRRSSQDRVKTKTIKVDIDHFPNFDNTLYVFSFKT